MALNASSKPGSWTSQLYDVLRPAPHPLMIKFSNSRSRFRHSPGDIWRHALSSSVYHDLAGSPGGFCAPAFNERKVQPADSTSCSLDRPLAAVRTRTWRRFVRMEHFGLSGLLFYEIRLPSRGPGDDKLLEGLGGGVDEQTLLTLESVFGSPDDPSDPGMSVDALLDAVHAKLVYFPAYACTSFLMGQAVTAFFRNRHILQPRPDREGFSVLCSESPETCDKVFSTSNLVPLELELAPDKPVLKDDLELDGEYEFVSSWSSSPGDTNIMDAFSWDPNDPYVSLCVRSSNLPQSTRPVLKRSNDEIDDKEEEDGNTTTSTVDSIGPPTPPRICSVRLDTHLSLSSVAGHKSAAPPVFVSGGTFCLSVYDNLTSFLDLSASELQDDNSEWADLDGESVDEDDL